MSEHDVINLMKAREMRTNQKVPLVLSVRETNELCYFAMKLVAGVSLGLDYLDAMNSDMRTQFLRAFECDKNGSHLFGEKIEISGVSDLSSPIFRMTQFPSMCGFYGATGAVGVLFYLLYKGSGEISLEMTRNEVETFVAGLNLKMNISVLREENWRKEFLSRDVLSRSRAIGDEFYLATILFPASTREDSYSLYRKGQTRVFKMQKYQIYCILHIKHLVDQVFSYIDW